MDERVSCQYCGLMHDFMCPRIKSIEYDGAAIRRIEFRDSWNPPAPVWRRPLDPKRTVSEQQHEWMSV
jgi:hypothetical protein